MDFPDFELERVQSIWENQVDYNLTESGLHPFTLRELLDDRQLDQLLSLRLGYTQTNGTVALRQAISSRYAGAGIDNVLVTSGSAEANFIASIQTLKPGDELVYMVPNYMQIWGIAQGLGARVVPLRLHQDLDWQIDPDELESAESFKTKVISVCNPNNPTGSVLNDDTRDRLVAVAQAADAWLFVDEVYRGAELAGDETRSLWGRYEKTVVTGGLSKAYGLPGLRLGWLVGPEEFIAGAWAMKDYTTIAPGALSDQVATFVLESGLQTQIFERNRTILRDNLSYLEDWITQQNGRLKLTLPKAGGMAFMQYDMDINSSELATRLRQEESTLVVPGDCFGMDGFLRLGFGSEKGYLSAGLDRIATFLSRLKD
ncbi:MAG TPA: aspartate aminotransferase [Dehalococcoidia bacterium]|nr:aspartate aminotransferase [Dehalococcoidia bacterium]